MVAYILFSVLQFAIDREKASCNGNKIIAPQVPHLQVHTCVSEFCWRIFYDQFFHLYIDGHLYIPTSPLWHTKVYTMSTLVCVIPCGCTRLWLTSVLRFIFWPFSFSFPFRFITPFHFMLYLRLQKHSVGYTYWNAYLHVGTQPLSATFRYKNVELRALYMYFFYIFTRTVRSSNEIRQHRAFSFS